MASRVPRTGSRQSARLKTLKKENSATDKASETVDQESKSKTNDLDQDVPVESVPEISSHSDSAVFYNKTDNLNDEEKQTKANRKRQNQKKVDEKQDLEDKDDAVPTKRATKILDENENMEKSCEESLQVKSGDTAEDIEKKVCTMENMLIGAHVSAAKSLANAVENASLIGCKAFALFLRSQRRWVQKPLEPKAAEKFKAACKEYGYDSSVIVPHGPYIMNCGAPKEEILEKSRKLLVEELERCEMLGLTLYNLHPGSSCGEITTEECIEKIADSINMALKSSSTVTVLLENMSCQGHTIGGKFEELRAIIDKIEDQSRIGVCLDTCHAMAAGYDLSQESGYKQMVDDFEKHVGFKYLKAVHLNDSVGVCGCHRDLHENIGHGKIGLNGFKRIMNDPQFINKPMILETPANVDDSTEIKKLYKLIKI